MDINAVWNSLSEQVNNCRKCTLCQARRNAVLGDGPRDNFKFVLIGEAPGENEDIQGKPFVGKAGQLLNDMLANAKLKRDDIYITNVIKCRPKGNQTPGKLEMYNCREFLEAQLLLLKPQIIVTMGNPATQSILNTSQGITSLRGKWQTWRGIELLPMFHPSFLLHNEGRPGDAEYRQLAFGDFVALSTRLRRS